MKLKLLILLIFPFITLVESIPSKLDKKVDKAITKLFTTEEFTKSIIDLAPENIANLPADFEDRFYTIQDAEGLLGYAYVGNAPSKTATFDYLILLDKDLTIMQSKVLIYREEYGGEIGSKRWLKQFIGKTMTDGNSLKYGDNISAISGATISVRSMTTAINDVLVSLKTLHAKGVL